MAKIPFITELNNIPICASRAECTQTGQNIDDALDGIVTNVNPLVAGNNVTLTQNSYGTLISAYGSTGPSGPRGATGLTGATGPTGACGPLGFCGPSGATGNRGFCGPLGYCGPSGAVGPKGVSSTETFACNLVNASTYSFTPNSTLKDIDTWNRVSGIVQYQFHTASSTSFVISVEEYINNTRQFGMYYQINSGRDQLFYMAIQAGTTYSVKCKLISGTASTVYARCNYATFSQS